MTSLLLLGGSLATSGVLVTYNTLSSIYRYASNETKKIIKRIDRHDYLNIENFEHDYNELIKGYNTICSGQYKIGWDPTERGTESYISYTEKIDYTPEKSYFLFNCYHRIEIENKTLLYHVLKDKDFNYFGIIEVDINDLCHCYKYFIRNGPCIVVYRY